MSICLLYFVIQLIDYIPSFNGIHIFIHVRVYEVVNIVTLFINLTRNE